MKKKLPNIYKGMVKNSNQNQKQSFISHEREESTYENEENLEKNFSHKNVNRQIKEIFSSPRNKRDFFITEFCLQSECFNKISRWNYTRKDYCRKNQQ